MDELEADLAELEHLHGLASSAHVRALLGTHVTQLRAELDERKAKPPPTLPTVSPTAKAPATSDSAARVTAPAAPTPSKSVCMPAKPVRLQVASNAAASSSSEPTYVPIGSHSWDQDSYGKEPNNVYVYVLSGFDGIGQQKECVSCEFTHSSFDLKVRHSNSKLPNHHSQPISLSPPHRLAGARLQRQILPTAEHKP